MPEVMNSHVLQRGAHADAAPRLLQIGNVGALHLAGDDPGIVVLVAKAGENGAGLRPKGNHPPASLGVPQLDAIVLDVFPAQELEFRETAAGQLQQAEDRDGQGHLGFGFAEDLAQPLRLLGRQEPLPLALLVALDVAAGTLRRPLAGAASAGARRMSPSAMAWNLSTT